MKAEETLRFLPLSDGKQPFYMWATIPVLKIISDPLVAARSLSILCGLMSMIGVGYLSLLLFKSKRASLASVLMYSLSSYTFFFDRMALADSMLAMFGIWTFIFSYLSIKTERLDFSMLAGFALGGAWLTKSPALFFALMLPVFWVFSSSLKKLPKSVFFSLVTLAIGYSMYNILRLGPNFHMIASRNLDYVYPLNHLLTSPQDPFKTFFKQYFEWVFAMGPWSLLLLSVLGIVTAFKKNSLAIGVLLIWILFPVLVQSEFAKVFTARYVLSSIPFLIVLASSAFVTDLKNQKLVAYLILATGGVFSLVFNLKLIFNPATANLPSGERSGYLEEWSAGQGIFEVSRLIRTEQLANPEQKIVVGTEGYFGTLPDGLQMYLNDLRQITVIGVGLNLVEVPTSLVESKKFGNKTFLVINNERFKGDPDKLGLKLIKAYPKATRANGTQQSLLFFEVMPQK